jgi:hypothetical protein
MTLWIYEEPALQSQYLWLRLRWLLGLYVGIREEIFCSYLKSCLFVQLLPTSLNKRKQFFVLRALILM